MSTSGHNVLPQSGLLRTPLKRESWKILREMEAKGLVELTRINLPVGRRVFSRIGRYTVLLSEAGRTVYREMTGEEPVDSLLIPFVERHRTVEHGVFVLYVKMVLGEWDKHEDCRWTYTVIDVAEDPDEALEHVPGTQRNYSHTNSDGSTISVSPDLVVQMQSSSGRRQLVVVEVEPGGLDHSDLLARWKQAILCYSPMTLYVIGPNRRERDRLLRTWREALDQVKQHYGLLHSAEAVFYTPEELEEHGLLSMNQLATLRYLQQQARGNGEKPSLNTNLPNFWQDRGQAKAGGPVIRDRVEEG